MKKRTARLLRRIASRLDPPKPFSLYETTMISGSAGANYKVVRSG